MNSEIKIKAFNKTLIISITIIILLSVIGIVTISRESVYVREKPSIRSMSYKTELDWNSGLNENEIDILFLLARSPQITNASSANVNWSHTLLNNLSKYLSKEGISLNPDKAEKIKQLIQGSINILQFETKKDINEMSIEGRKLVLHIYNEIFNLCGLDITFDVDSNIEKIVDRSGEIIYQNISSEDQPLLHFDALAIVFAIIMVLTILSIIVAKKKQLFIKGGNFDGFDEKEYA